VASVENACFEPMISLGDSSDAEVRREFGERRKWDVVSCGKLPPATRSARVAGARNEFDPPESEFALTRCEPELISNVIGSAVGATRVSTGVNALSTPSDAVGESTGICDAKVSGYEPRRFDFGTTRLASSSLSPDSSLSSSLPLCSERNLSTADRASCAASWNGAGEARTANGNEDAFPAEDAC
jgi:hypothetical protein